MAKRMKATGYEKISATIEAPVLRQIRERTANVSGFLNEAAKRELYFDMLRATAEELRSQGVKRDERFYQNLKRFTREAEARYAARRKRALSRAR